MATLVTGAAEAKEDSTCTVCMDCVSEKNQCLRPCGHMICAPCDAAWQSRGRIQEFKMQRKDKKSNEKISIYMTVSSCPSCRRKDVPHDYHGRSKVSMIHEIQFLTRTLYLSGISAPFTYQPPAFSELEEVPVITTPPVPIMQRIMHVITPYIPPVAVAGLPPVPPSSQTTGICCRRVQIGACYTTRTKLKCGRCNRFLCRSCRGSGCVCA